MEPEPISESDIDFIDLRVMKGAQFQRLVPLAIRAGLVSGHGLSMGTCPREMSGVQTYSDRARRKSPLSHRGDRPALSPPSPISLQREESGCPEVSSRSFITPEVIAAGVDVLAENYLDILDAIPGANERAIIRILRIYEAAREDRDEPRLLPEAASCPEVSYTD